MTIKEKLQRYAYTLEYAKELEEKLASTRERMTSISSMKYDDISASSGVNDKIGNAIAKLIELEHDYLDKICELADLELEINAMINILDAKEQKLIRLRYLKCEKWEDICGYMGYSWQGVHKLHNSILIKLEKSRLK